MYRISSCGQLTRSGLPPWGLGKGPTTPVLKKSFCYEMLHRALVKPVAGSCEYGNELSGSIKGGEFLISQVTISFSRRPQLYGVGWLVG
jgi:hypothetical protein